MHQCLSLDKTGRLPKGLRPHPGVTHIYSSLITGATNRRHLLHGMTSYVKPENPF
jgi:hypothetical protein